MFKNSSFSLFVTNEVLKLNWADGKILHGMPSSSKTINEHSNIK